MTGFNPYLEDPHPCWTCHWFAGLTAQDTAALCSNPGCSRVRSLPEHGCSAWEREPGADDGPLTRDQVAASAPAARRRPSSA